MLQLLSEQLQVAVGNVPVDFSTGPITGDYVNVSGYHSALALIVKKAGTGGEDATVTLRQATSAAGAGVKDLSFQNAAVKVGADLQAVGQYTRTTQDAAALVGGLAGATQALVLIEIPIRNMDIAGGFKFVTVVIGDTGATAGAWGTILYLLGSPRYAQSALQSVLT